MQINADLSRKAVVHADALPWIPSPLPGVDRRMLARDGAEVAVATSIVRYAPGSRFTAHTHGLGEELLVLDGVFADEHGVYPRGTYVRNPPGSSHAPFTEAGCTILVKLRQMHPEDAAEVRVATDLDAAWPASETPGVQRLQLHEDRWGERVHMERWTPGAEAALRHPAGFEALVLAGAWADEAGEYPQGTWLRLPAGSAHHPRSAEGCILWVKRGHLPTAAAVRGGAD